MWLHSRVKSASSSRLPGKESEWDPEAIDHQASLPTATAEAVEAVPAATSATAVVPTTSELPLLFSSDVHVVPKAEKTLTPDIPGLVIVSHNLGLFVWFLSALVLWRFVMVMHVCRV